MSLKIQQPFGISKIDVGSFRFYSLKLRLKRDKNLDIYHKAFNNTRCTTLSDSMVVMSFITEDKSKFDAVCREVFTYIKEIQTKRIEQKYSTLCGYTLPLEYYEHPYAEIEL